MNVLSLTYEYPPIGGGGSVVAAALNEEMAANGHTVRVVTSRMAGLAEKEQVNGVEVYRVRCWRRFRHLSTFPELATTLLPTYLKASHLIKHSRPDLIHTHFALPCGWEARHLSRRFGIPYVVTGHGSDIPGYNPDRFIFLHRILSSFWKRIMNDAACVTSQSNFLAGLIRQKVQLPVEIIPNGFSPAPSQSLEKRNMILVVARLFRRKGVEYFIEAVQELETDWEMVIAGDGPSADELKRQAADLNGRVRFVGFVDKVTLRGLYEQARIMVFPSLRENFPMVLLEAMDAGCAIVTTDADGCAEVVEDSGIVVPKANAEAIRSVLRSLIDDPARIRELGAQALNRVSGFRWSRIAGMYTECFEKVLRESRLSSDPKTKHGGYSHATTGPQRESSPEVIREQSRRK